MWTPAIAYAIFIMILSSTKVPLIVASWIKYDKVIHFVEYGMFTFLWYRALRFSMARSYQRWVVLVVILVSISFAAVDEIFQSKNPVRVSDFQDFIADGIGSVFILSIMVYSGWRKGML